MILRGITQSLVNEDFKNLQAVYDYWFAKGKMEKENLGLVDFRKNELYFEEATQDFYGTHMLPYFHELLAKGPDISMQEFLKYERFPKTVWLAREFLMNNGFKNPMGVHWEPRLDYQGPEDNWPEVRDKGLWRIHPGGSRQTVYYYFAPDEYKIPTICFNTHGKPPPREWKKVFTHRRELQEFYNGHENYFMELVPDRGTFIPHILTDSKDVWENGLNEHRRICNQFKDWNVETNFPMADELGLTSRTMNSEHTLVMELDHPSDRNAQIRACIMLCFPIQSLTTVIEQWPDIKLVVK